MIMMKLCENKGRFSITIPKDIIIKKGWKKGTNVLVNFNERGNVELEELKS